MVPDRRIRAGFAKREQQPQHLSRKVYVFLRQHQLYLLRVVPGSSTSAAGDGCLAVVKELLRFLAGGYPNQYIPPQSAHTHARGSNQQAAKSNRASLDFNLSERHCIPFGLLKVAFE